MERYKRLTKKIIDVVLLKSKYYTDQKADGMISTNKELLDEQSIVFAYNSFLCINIVDTIAGNISKKSDKNRTK